MSLGTSGVLFVSNDRFRPNTGGAVHAFCHAIPDTWHQMGVILSATDSLNWLARRHRQKQAATLTGAARRGASSGPGEEIFLPYLAGERTPHNDAAARGSFVGLAHATGRSRADAGGDGGRRLRLPRLPAALNEAGTESIAASIAVGGGSRSRSGLKIIANMLDIADRPCPRTAISAAALGAARLGLSPPTAPIPPQSARARAGSRDHRARRAAVGRL